MAGKEIAQLQHSCKFVKKVKAAIMRQPPVITGDLEVSWCAAQLAPHLTKSEVRLTN